MKTKITAIVLGFSTSSVALAHEGVHRAFDQSAWFGHWVLEHALETVLLMGVLLMYGAYHIHRRYGAS